MSRSPSFARLALQPLEDRATPATAVYTALTHTLTVTAHEGDQLVVAPMVNKPTGYLLVTETQGSATVFNSDMVNRTIRNLVFKFGGVNSGAVTFNADARIGGSLIISGAKSSQTVNLLGTVGANVIYTPNTLDAFEDIDFEASAVVGGNVNVGLGLGENALRLKGGRIHGNLSVMGGAGVDIVEMMEGGNLTVNGSATMNLAGGNNLVLGKGLAPVMYLDGNFVYMGGSANDTFNLDASGAAISAKGDIKMTLGTPTGFDSNLAKLEALIAGKSIVINGGGGEDKVLVSGAIVAGTNVTLALGNGSNEFDSDEGGMAANTISGNLSYMGGTGTDIVRLDAMTIGRNLTVALGESAQGGGTLFVGLKAPGAVNVFGNVKVTGGSGSEGILFRRMYVGGSLAVTTGAGNDVVTFDNTNIAGTTLVDLGAGDDWLQSELLTSDGAGSLSGATTFGGTVTIKAGDGADLMDLSGDTFSETFIQFGSRLIVQGGSGGDTLRTSTDNILEVSTNFTDVEVVDGPSLP